MKGTERWLPLYEAKMIHHFDHGIGSDEGQTESQAIRCKLPKATTAKHQDATYTILPRYWVSAEEVEARLKDKWPHPWLLGWRDTRRSTDARTVIASLIPCTALGHTNPLMFQGSKISERLLICLLANLSSFALDYAARQKIGGTHLTYNYLTQLPVVPPETYEGETPWQPEATLEDWIASRVLELVYTAEDLRPLAEAAGYEGSPFRWDEERRSHLRCELDAAFFHLYGLTEDDAAYILDTFPIIKRQDEKTHGEYRTKRVILEKYKATLSAVAAERSPTPGAQSRRKV